MATKEARRQAKGVIEGLEYRVHSGPPVRDVEIRTARDFLRQHDFAPASDYFSRLIQIEHRLSARPPQPIVPQGKRNYGGKAAGRHMQVQSVYDHLIVSTCHEGDFNTQHGRIKISHRFNRAGRIDFVELKFLRSLHPCLTGEIRKLLLVKDYQSLRKDWREAEAFVLPALPRELVFLYDEVFRTGRADLIAWLVNIGHGMVGDLVADLRALDQSPAPAPEPEPACYALGRSDYAPAPELAWQEQSSVQTLTLDAPANPRWRADRADWQAERPVEVSEEPSRAAGRRNPDQLQLEALLHDPVALPILEKVASLQTAVALQDEKNVLLHY